MKIKLDWQKRRTENSIKIWKGWYAEYLKGKSVVEIANESINPANGKHYSWHSIYYGFERLKSIGK